MNRMKELKRKQAHDDLLALTPLKVEVLSFLLEKGTCAQFEAARAACGTLGVDYMTKVQYHRLFKELEASGLVACHRQFRQVQVEVPPHLQKQVSGYLEAYRLLAHAVYDVKQARSAAELVALRELQAQTKPVSKSETGY